MSELQLKYKEKSAIIFIHKNYKYYFVEKIINMELKIMSEFLTKTLNYHQKFYS